MPPSLRPVFLLYTWKNNFQFLSIDQTQLASSGFAGLPHGTVCDKVWQSLPSHMFTWLAVLFVWGDQHATRVIYLFQNALEVSPQVHCTSCCVFQVQIAGAWRSQVLLLNKDLRTSLGNTKHCNQTLKSSLFVRYRLRY